MGGRYSAEIARIVGHLEAAIPFATDAMAAALGALVRFYRSGEADDRRQYDIAWVADQASPVDTMMSFIEVYMDARGVKGAWEAIVYYVHPEKTAHAQAIAGHAQWFEDRMPWAPQYRKPRVTGVTARAVEVVIETGDAGPMTPIGVNLPNDQEIRETHGSKSVSLSNVTEAYEKSTPRWYRAEFAWSQAEVDRAERWGAFASELTTNLHEIIGHGSGLVSPALNGAPEKALKEHFSAIEEARADLVALYFISRCVPGGNRRRAGGRPAGDRARRVPRRMPGTRSCSFDASARVRRSKRTTCATGSSSCTGCWPTRPRSRWRDATARRTTGSWTRRAFTEGVGTLLAEVQRIKAEGDYQAASELLETYGVHFDPGSAR